MKNEPYHEPVMVSEVLFWAPLKKQARIIDATLGTGGHSLEFVKKGADVLGIDTDEKMIEVSSKRLRKACPTPNQNGLGSFKLIHGNFKDIDRISGKEGFENVDSVIFDLGTSNLQLTSPDRGFSFTNPEADLDMRMDPKTQGLKGMDLLNVLRKDQLFELFNRVLPFWEAKVLSKRVIEFRERKKFEKVEDFLEACEGMRKKAGLNPATLPFLALRIAVNSELENLSEALPKAFDLLAKEGRLLIIVFHSGERKVVLDFFYGKVREGRGNMLSEKGIIPEEKEILKNPRARSAVLYVLEKK